ncbi:MAG: IS21-like element helper ATPase IstB [Nitrososphaeraceae archaeon]
MNNQVAIERMKQLRLYGMAEFHQQNLEAQQYQDYTLDQYIAILLEQEYDYRTNKKTYNLIKQAGFSTLANVENINYQSDRNLNRNQFERLVNLDFITHKENVLFTGATGTGKSYLAQALGMKACLKQLRVIHYNTSKLIEKLKLARIEGNYAKFIEKIDKCDLLILDDFGLSPIDANTRQALMEIVEAKYDKGSIIITSQVPVSQWHQLIGENTIADAILDRLVYSSHRIELGGESMRKNRKLNQ